LLDQLLFLLSCVGNCDLFSNFSNGLVSRSDVSVDFNLFFGKSSDCSGESFGLCLSFRSHFSESGLLGKSSLIGLEGFNLSFDDFVFELFFFLLLDDNFFLGFSIISFIIDNTDGLNKLSDDSLLILDDCGSSISLVEGLTLRLALQLVDLSVGVDLGLDLLEFVLESL
jgi:hypothetical protein